MCAAETACRLSTLHRRAVGWWRLLIAYGNLLLPSTDKRLQCAVQSVTALQVIPLIPKWREVSPMLNTTEISAAKERSPVEQSTSRLLQRETDTFQCDFPYKHPQYKPKCTDFFENFRLLIMLKMLGDICSRLLLIAYYWQTFCVTRYLCRSHYCTLYCSVVGH